MKQLLFLLAFMPAILFGQSNTKYLADAVPEVGGKVVFSKEIEVASLDKNLIYDALLGWCKQKFNDEASRVVYSDEAAGDIIVAGETELVFQKSALSLDKAKMYYRFTAKAENGKCDLKVSNIRYVYNVSYQKDPEKYTAETWITDKNALNKNKTKLNRGNGKFRTKTIDFVDELFDGAMSAIGVKSISPVVASSNGNKASGDSTPISSSVKPKVKEPKSAEKKGYTSYTTENVPNALISALQNETMTVTKGKSNKIVDEKASFGKFQEMFGKKVAVVYVNESSELNKEFNTNDTFTLNFYENGNEKSNPSVIIECSLQGKTPSKDDIIIMGEVQNIWVK
jgi:hypothetical protein